MRIALSIAAFLLLLPGDVSAGRIEVELGFLNSDLTFGFVNPDQAGYDLYGFWIDGADYFGSQADGTFNAASGPLVGQTLVTDGGGTVTASKYLYEGGTFHAELFGVESTSGALVSGSFVTSIISLEILAAEGLEAPVVATYVLGPGLLDAAFADALGIPRGIRGGWVQSFLLLTDAGNRPGTGGDFNSPERQAWDGGTSVLISVPEPSVSLLAALGLSAGCLWRRRVKGSPATH